MNNYVQIPGGSGGGGGGETLAQTLVLGNVTGGTDLEVTAADTIFFPDDTNISFGNTAAAPDATISWDTGITPDMLNIESTGYIRVTPANDLEIRPAAGGIVESLTTINADFKVGNTFSSTASGDFSDWSTMQSIATSGGMLTSGDNFSPFYIQANPHATDVAGTIAAGNYVTAGPGASAGDIYGIWVDFANTLGVGVQNNTGELRGFVSTINNDTADDIYGFFGAIETSAAVTNLVGASLAVTNDTAAATTMRGVDVTVNPNVAAIGEVTGVRVDNSGSQTADTAIYIAGAWTTVFETDTEFTFVDTNKAASSFAGALKLSETAAEWTAYDTAFGEVSLLNAIQQASTTGGITQLTGDVTAGPGSGSQVATIAAKAVEISMLDDGTDGELITWDAAGVAATVATGTATHVLTSNGPGLAPTFQAAAGGGNTLDQAYDQGGAGAGSLITADTGAVRIVVPDTSGNAGLTVAQNDTTNNPDAVDIANAGTGHALELSGSGTRDINSTSGDITLCNTTTGNVILDPVTEVQLLGGQKVERTTVSDSIYTILVTDYLIALTAITAARTWTLPTAASAGAGKVFVVKDESGSLGGATRLKIDGNGAETVDGAADIDLKSAYESVTLYCDGSNWFII